ncbi:MAG: hypothetical protein B6245_00340 [Desulfobacteraceae bacterium 4572_88]|nr:MAG: hypothetical protein B6245_00340 [Desulfobacteraceae bacterium 4572_88]
MIFSCLKFLLLFFLRDKKKRIFEANPGPFGKIRFPHPYISDIGMAVQLDLMMIFPIFGKYTFISLLCQEIIKKQPEFANPIRNAKFYS